MCNEARGLSRWPRKLARWVALLTAATLAFAVAASRMHPAGGAEPSPGAVELTPNSPDEPLVEKVSLPKALAESEPESKSRRGR